MKRIKIKIAIGIVLMVLITILLGSNSERMYQKKEHFKSANDVLCKLDTKDFYYYNNKSSRIETDAFKECLSKRKRLAASDFNMDKIKVEKRIELNEDEKKLILDDYNSLRKNYKVKDQHITDMEPVRIKAKTYYENGVKFENGKHNVEYLEENSIVTFVLIDEGEGLVVDYIVENDADQEN